MGALFSSDISPAVFKGISTNLATREQRRLYRRFMRLSRGAPVLSADQLSRIPELTTNPLRTRITSLFVDLPDNQISFASFLRNLEGLSIWGSLDDMLTFSFKVYDVDGDGIISASDIEAIIMCIIGDLETSVSPTLIENSVRNTLHGFSQTNEPITLELFSRTIKALPGAESRFAIAF
ncbi:Serine/threonine-protein phosphatase 2B regulatory subunit [Giardia muris]|uniref:Serine/threonine-protein phosphatase 2B regulatory subunit n=1 Tax=Giardia muris TaxID=5742 RepID=A0A4Z1T2T7_GIAMU|nr:Serine/threonine-protein phosphatase 2B regulatory subunit [Giardia muris]|eukprot:TNJ29958.1 Serine/threonine-protein phosphatase 2B regulatory subunit [Giardia muris]